MQKQIIDTRIRRIRPLTSNLPISRKIYSRLGLYFLATGLCVSLGLMTYALSHDKLLSLSVVCLTLPFCMLYVHGISLECCIIITVLLVNLFLIKRYDHAWSFVLGGIRYGVTSLLAAGTFIILALKLYMTKPATGSVTKQPAAPMIMSPKKLILLCCVGIVSIIANTFGTGEMLGSFSAMVKMLLPFLLLYLIPKLPLKSSEIHLVSLCYVGSGVLIALLLISSSLLPDQYSQLFGWEKFGGGGSTSFSRSMLPFGAATGAASVLVIILPLSYFMQSVAKTRLHSMIFVAATLLMVLGIIFSLTRGALFGLFGLLVLWLFSKRGGRTTIKFLVVLLIAVVTAISFYKYDLSRYTSFETGRFETWKAAVLIVKDHPLLGVAPNTIYQRTDLMDLTAPKYFVYGGYLSPHSSHNDFLSILTEYGPLGLILFVLILKDIGQRLFFASGRYINRENSFILLGTFWGFIVLISQSLKESLIISNPRIAVILLVYLGIGLLVVARSIRPSFNNSGRVMKWTGNVETFKTQPELQS